MIEAIAFDLDGTLVDTEPLHCLSYIEALKEHDVILTEEEYYSHWTRSGKGISDFIKGRDLKLDPDSVRTEKRRIYQQRIRENVPILDGAKNTLEVLSREYPKALVTSSYLIDVDLILDTTRLRKYFKVVVTANDVRREKPDPEGYLLAVARLNISPENILAIEDAEKGVVAAYESGMKIIAIPNLITRNHNFSLADMVLSSIKELTPELLERI